MSMAIEDLRVLQIAEKIADSIWKHVTSWEKFARDTIGNQLVRAVDSIGANIAESFGRFHYGEKLHHLYIARGSLFETKYWINCASRRGLFLEKDSKEYAVQLTDLARLLNSFANSMKSQRTKGKNQPSDSQIREDGVIYDDDSAISQILTLFSDEELLWLNTSDGQQLNTSN
jgi:four helix bundle protein